MFGNKSKEIAPFTILAELCRYKNERVYAATKMSLITSADFEKMSNWDYDAQRHVVDSMQNTIFKGMFNDTPLCPWCVVNSSYDSGAEARCSACSYAEIHGKCSVTGGDTYAQISLALSGKSISTLLDKEEVEYILQYGCQRETRAKIKVPSGKIKIFHFDDPQVRYILDSKVGDVYPNKEYFGHFVTNKATRDSRHYAKLVESEGRWANNISEVDFKRLVPAHGAASKRFEHIYVTSGVKFQELVKSLNNLSGSQLTALSAIINAAVRKS